MTARRATAPPAAPFAGPRGRLRLALPAVAAALALAWLLGLVWFAQTIPDEIADPETPTDAIAVLTGGSLRLGAGLELLAAGKARKLFVSGVHSGVEIGELLRLSPQIPSRVGCCIVLGHAADSTRGNAQETAAWMRGEAYRSLRLVTASYHMRRSLFEFARAMPGVRIVANPVFPERVRQADWWAWPGTAALIIGEYHKYLGAVLRAALDDADAVGGGGA